MNKNKLLKINNITFSSNKSFISLFNHLSNNVNNLNNNDLINIYKELFKIILILIQNNLISIDLYNLNNYLFDNKNNFIYLSNNFNFNFININSKLSPKEIFIYYLYYIIRFDLNNHLYKFIINKEIFYKSLNKILNKNILEKIYKDLFINYSLTKTKFNLIYYLNKDYIINILYLSIYNFNKLNTIKSNIKNILTKNNDELNDNTINKYNFNKLEKDYINLKLNYKNIKNILDDLIFVLQKENNDDIILYYNKSNPLIGFVKKDLNNSNINNYIKIKTNKYLKLNNKFNLNDLNDLNKKNKKIEEKYFILDYNIESYILNWCGYINKYHYLSYAGLRLYSLNRKLFNEIVNDYKTLDNHNFTKKYKSDKYINDVLLQRSIGSIINCLNRNINFKNEFNNLTNYINKNKKKYKILFRGERRYEITNFNNIIEYKNIHTFTDNKEEAIKFMSNYYFNYDNNIKEYNLFILINGLTAKIKPLLINDKEEISNWTEYLHTKTKYKIIKIKKDKININYKNNEIKTLNYNIIYLNE